jgi:C-terminal processing protease CtpA/Prc
MDALSIFFRTISFSLVFFVGSVQAENALEDIVNGLDDDSFDVRSEAREKLSEHIVSGKAEVIDQALQHFATHQSPEVRLSMKTALMHRLYGKGFLGVRHDEVLIPFKGKTYLGRRIESISPGGPASKSELKAGDHVLTLGKVKPVGMDIKRSVVVQHREEAARFSSGIKALPPGSVAEISVVRAGKLVKVKVKLGSYQNFLMQGENTSGYQRLGETIDSYGFSTEENEKFRQLVAKFKTKHSGKGE